MERLINGRPLNAIKSGMRNMLESCADISGVKDTICGELCCSYEDDNCCHETIIMSALALIEHLEAERDAALAKVPKWISVKNPPKEDGDYIALIALHQKPTDYTLSQPWFVSRVYYRKNVGFHWHSGKVTHWMPLPSEPKEGE